MEKINSEILISSLFYIGFDKVDSILFTYTLAKLSIDNRLMKTFEYDDEEFCHVFNEYIRCVDGIYQPIEDIDLDTLVPFGEKLVPLRKRLHTNKKLVEYLSLLDFREIIFKKITLLSDKHIDTLPDYFCDKEKEIISKIFGINTMYQKRAINSTTAYESIYNEEASELKKMSFDDIVANKIIARNEERIKLSTSYDYINWLKSFTDRQGDFYTDDFTYRTADISDEDYHNISELGSFYDIIDEYAIKNNAASKDNKEDHYYLIKHDAIGFKIGFIWGQGTVFCCERTIPSEKAINFDDIVTYYAKTKPKTRKKTI